MLLAGLGIKDLDLLLKERRLRLYAHMKRSNGAVKTACEPVTYRLMENMGLGDPK